MANRDIPGPSHFRGGANFTATQTAWLSMFDAQKAAVANASRAQRRRYEAQIKEIEAEIRKLRKEEEDTITTLKNHHAPAGTYVPLVNYEMNKKCWEEYTRRLRDAGFVVPIITDSGLKEAHNAFNETVRRRHVLEFLRRDNNEELLTAYVDKTVSGEPWAKGERRLRELLKIVGFEPTPPPAIDVSDTDDEDPMPTKNKGKRVGSVEISGGTRRVRPKK